MGTNILKMWIVDVFFTLKNSYILPIIPKSKTPLVQPVCPKLQTPFIKDFLLKPRFCSRSPTTPRDKASGSEHIQKKNCIICWKTQHGNTRDKCRISESPRANVFLAAALYFQDAIYTRIADLQDDLRVFGADLYYHRACLPNYLNKYERALSEKKPPKIFLKRHRFCDEVGAIRNLLDRGIGLSLSDIRDAINDKYDEDFISNKEVKLYLTEHFQDDVQFCPSERRNESMFVFSSALSVEDVVKKLRSVNVIKEGAVTIREALGNVDFNLNDKFGDAHELKSSWERTAIPDCLVCLVNDNFTLGALDNFDSADRSSASGKYSTHDTVMVLFQEKPEAVPSKPNVSDFTLPNNDQSGAVHLSCQSLKQYTGKKKFLPLPESLIVDTDLYLHHSLEKENQDFVLEYVRMLASSETTDADARLVPHAKYAFDNGFERDLTVSNDSDVVALALHHMNIFSTSSSSELWILYGTGENSKFIPIHLMASILGPNHCSAIMKAHVLTRCDVTSQVGSKTSALKNDPEKYLGEFAEDPQLTYSAARKAEEYLVKVLKPQSESNTFDSLRHESYTAKNVKLFDLPPTSSAILGHLKRCHYVVRYNKLLLNSYSERPQDHGWTEIDGFLIPDKHLMPMLLHYTVRCGCKSRCTGRCRCSKMDTICTEFCSCKGNCQNV